MKTLLTRKKGIAGLLLIATMMMTLLVSGCGNTADNADNSDDNVQSPGKKAKYVFMFIGDGMAMPQINAAEVFMASTAGADEPVKLNFSQFPAQGLTTTYSASSFITDSAAAGTAIACGSKTDSGVISMNSNKTQTFKTIAELAHEAGQKVGIVSTVSIDHATPATFYAHQASRKMYYEIGVDLANSGFEYFGGGKFKRPTGDEKDQPSTIDMAKENGYTVVEDKAAFDKLTADSGKVIAFNPVVADGNACNYDMDRTDEEISIVEYTKKGIELLDNPNGFFLMVESGKIDWACHANDAAAALKDTIAMDQAIGQAVQFYQQHPDETLIIVTGDHETGGLTLGFAGTQYDTYFDKVNEQTMSYVAFDQILNEYKASHQDNAKMIDLFDEIEQAFGLKVYNEAELAELEKKAETDEEAAKDLGMALTTTDLEELESAFEASMQPADERPSDEQTYLMYGGYEPFSVTLTHILNHKAGISWTTYSHTGVPVPTFALGAGQDSFNGYYDNTEIFSKTKEAMGI